MSKIKSKIVEYLHSNQLFLIYNHDLIILTKICHIFYNICKWFSWFCSSCFTFWHPVTLLTLSDYLCLLCTSAAPQSAHCLATFFRFFTSRPFRANRAPSLANMRLVPAPIPELAPVIRATFPFREDTWENKVGPQHQC